MDIDKRVEEMLKKKHEGKVFAYVFTQQAFGTFWATREYYTIKEGVVYAIQSDGLYATGDTVFDTVKDCIMVGKYNPKFKYKRTSKSYNYREMIKLLKL